MHPPSLAALLGLLILSPLSGQSPTEAADSAPAITLHAESRIVLADVTVTDRHGNAVHGLSAADFEVFDNNQPQRIASFEEHNGDRNVTSSDAYNKPAAHPNTASNIYTHLPPVLNVVLLDTTNLELTDQMYLHIQLTRFIKSLPAGRPIAIFARHGDYTTIVQPFTADHVLLQAAIDRALPRIVAVGREYRTDTDTLRQIGLYLRQVPGRKNVLWFTGGSTAYLMEGLSALTAPTAIGPPPNSAVAAATQASSSPSTAFAAPSVGEGDALREVYDELEAARVAIYPIDARGLTTEGDVALGPEQSEMVQTAEATGGEAIINRNSLALAADHIVSTDSSSYTLTWSPQNFHYDGKWHNIRVTPRNREYHLSYRRGYFADKPHPLPPSEHKLTALITGNSKQTITAPDLHSSPLLFEATVHPVSDSTAADAAYVPLRPAAAPAKGNAAYRVDYSVSTAGLSASSADGAPRATVFFAAVALDSDGNRIGQTLDRVRFPLAPGDSAHQLQVEQQIDLPHLSKSGGFLALSVWDPVSGHVGTLQIPITAAAKSR